jgi:hypothetical protein
VAEQIVTAVAERTSETESADNEHLAWDGDVIVSTVPAVAELQGYEPDRFTYARPRPDHQRIELSALGDRWHACGRFPRSRLGLALWSHLAADHCRRAPRR